MAKNLQSAGLRVKRRESVSSLYAANTPELRGPQENGEPYDHHHSLLAGNISHTVRCFNSLWTKFTDCS